MAPSALQSSLPSYSIASIPADGIGPEVISAGIQVLRTLAKALGNFELDFTHFDWDSARYKKEGKYLPDDALEQLKKFDAILFGAVGAPGMLLWPSLEVQQADEVNTQMCQITSPSGGSVSQSASRFNNMPMSARQESYGGPHLRCATALREISTG